jgi:CRP/FNR family transcriptional regulator, cyclic AMP receptor protein
MPNHLVRLLPKCAGTAVKHSLISRNEMWRERPREKQEDWACVSNLPASSLPSCDLDRIPDQAVSGEIDPLYLFACQVDWERNGDPSAAWEVISGTRSSNQNTRAYALSLLERSQQPRQYFPESGDPECRAHRGFIKEAGMRTPYGLDVIESCMGCKVNQDRCFCRFSPVAQRSIDSISHHSVMPSGALLFVEGQTPRGMYVLCSGKVKLSTTSKEGKVLILKQAEAGEPLGLSAAISGTNYEMTAETSTPCQLNFIGRRDLMSVMQNESEVAVHAAQSLSREFQGAYRDIHDLVLARSSSGKLAKLLLSCAPLGSRESDEQRLRSTMTHEEMAQRIGSSRETVTRLLSHLKKKRLIRLEGTTLVIRDRTGLEALAV